MMNEKPVTILTAERLRDLLIYDPVSGIFRWRVDRANVRAGDITGANDGKGYLVIHVDGGKYYAHRLAFLYMTGEWPVSLIDHIDRIPSNNRWENLRESTRQGNSANSRRYSNNTSGLKGVSWHKRDRKWRATISSVYVGSFNTPEEAHAAYLSAARLRYGDFASDGCSA